MIINKIKNYSISNNLNFNILIFSTFLYVFLVLISNKISFFYTNDDVLIDQILSGATTGQQSPIVSFTSQIVGTVFSKLYYIVPSVYSYFGLSQILVNYVTFICLIFFVLKSPNNLAKFIGSLLLLVLLPQSLLSPTFTITASLITAIGITGILFSFFKNQSFLFCLFFTILFLVGYLLRPLAFLLVNLLLTPGILILYFYNRKNLVYKQINLFIFVCLSLSTILIDKFITFYRYQNFSVREYWDVQDSIINFTPASLILQQKIIAGDAMNKIWSNVDFLVLNNWAYVNKEVFSIENLALSLTYLNNWRGFSGFLNSDPVIIFNEIANLFTSQLQLPMIFLLIVFISIVIIKNSSIFIILIAASVSNSLIIMYYLVSTLRVPDRLFYSYLIILLFILFQFFLLLNPLIKFEIHLKTFLLLGSVFLVYFHMFDYFGSRLLLNYNLQKSNFQKIRELELSEFSSTAIFVGPISYFPGNNQNVYKITNLRGDLEKRIISLSWANFSPTWNRQLDQNALDKSNLLNSLATKQNTFWVSDAYLAEILNYHMNDHKIYRGKLCSIKKLTGNDNAEIFTYQAKENDC